MEKVVHAERICTPANFRRVSRTRSSASRRQGCTIINAVSTEALRSVLHTCVNEAILLTNRLTHLNSVTGDIK